MKDCLTNCLRDRKVRYVPMVQTIYNWHKNRKKQYTALSLDDVGQKYKKSETIFILGGSESINDMTDEQWDHIAKHDSFAMNWWPIHPFVPTFYYTNYPREKEHRNKFREMAAKRVHDYANTIFFVSINRAVERGMHPRVIPDFFSDAPLCCFYEYVQPVMLGRGETFREGSFDRTIYYRGGLSLVLDLADKLGYKNIVLMGIDLKNQIHFYDSYPQMQWRIQKEYIDPIETLKKTKHGTMETKNGSKLPMDQYLYAVNDLYFKPKGVKLFAGSANSILSDKIPLYKFD